MKNLDELIEAALEYHLKKIEEEMQEAVNKGEPYIYYYIPAFLLDDENFRKGLERELEAAEYIIEKSKYSSYEFIKNRFKISCIEIIEDPIEKMEDNQTGDLNNDWID